MGNCALSYHDDSFFGLSKADSIQLHGIRKGDWTPANEHRIDCNTRRIEVIKQTILEEREVS